MLEQYFVRSIWNDTILFENADLFVYIEFCVIRLCNHHS